jgi:hypothetical protein
VIPSARDLVLVRKLALALAEHSNRPVEPSDFEAAAAMLCGRGKPLGRLKPAALLKVNGSAVDVECLVA